MDINNINRLLHSKNLHLGPNGKQNFATSEQSLNSRRDKSAIITGGIGDFLAIEPFVLSSQDKYSTIYLATRGHADIGLMLRKTYRNATLRNVTPNFPNNKYCFMSRLDVFNYLNDTKSHIPANFPHAEDLSISCIFPQIKNKVLQFTQSSYVVNNLADITRFNLPKDYIAFVSASTRDKEKIKQGRNLNEAEIKNIVNTATLPLVCVFCQCEKPHPAIKHLKGTHLFESVEIIKKAKGYIGVDSCLSVIAGFILKPEYISIKSINNHCYENKVCYYPLIHQHDFIFQDLSGSINRGP